MSALVATVRAELAARARPDKAPDMQAYLKSAMPVYGVPRAGHREIARALAPLDGFEAWRTFVLELWRGAEHREERYVALDVIALLAELSGLSRREAIKHVSQKKALASL